ncbi:MAG TPA: DUF423 domain-containing protein [Gammaproteobacteria bacterium]|nr:DUF423 domain-containing protein [Gammaproteobacteria bacterium]
MQDPIPREAKLLLSLAGVSLLCATIAGALGAHVLALDERGLRSFDSAVDFQFFHGLGLIAIALVGSRVGASRLIRIAAWLMVVGTVLFCGSIYARSLGAPGGIVAAAPYGGVAFMVAWVLFAIGVWRSPAR